jgi:endonuclease/exonuclease/phosphatase family metal-dependent hydrolase
MRSRLVAVVPFIAVAACGADPAAAPPQTLVVETFNVGLAGAFVPNEAERTRAVPTAVAGMTADIVCLQEAWRQEDKDAITAAARTRFPHAYSARHDLNTAVTQEIDPMCGGAMMVPAEPATAPCADPSVMSTFAAGITCLINNCSTMPGSDQGRTTSTACATANCIGDVASLLTAGAAGLRCYGCLAPQLTTETFASIRTSCTTNPRAGLAFNGQSGTMILSRYPLSETETVVIPGTWNRRVITRATATLPNGAKVGVYCNHLSPVRRRASAGRAVSLGDFNTSAASAPGQPMITDEAPETYALLRAAFREAIPQGFVPQCTYCPDNVLTGNAAPTWLDHIFLQGFTEASVRSAERTFTTPSVAVSGGATVPLSDHYGMRATIALTP